MRMTALAGSTTHVELCVASDRRAEAQGFHVVASDRFKRDAETESQGPALEGDSTGLTIGSPAVVPLLWDGAVVTKLTADLAPAQMERDVTVDLAESLPHRDHHYTGRARLEMATAVLLGGVAVTLVPAMLMFCGRRRPRRWERITLTILVAGVVISAVSVVAFVPAVPARAGRALHPYVQLGQLSATLRKAAAEGDLTPGRIEPFLVRLAHDPAAGTNPFTGEPVRLERSPGNFAIRKIGPTTFACLYDVNGREVHAIELSQPSTGPARGP